MATPEIEKLTKKTLSGFKWSGIATLVQGTLQLACFSVLAHLIGPKEFGIVGMATLFTNFVERVGFLGIGQAIIQREKLTLSHIHCGFVLCLCSGFLLFIGFYFAAPWIAGFFGENELLPVLRVISFSFLLASIYEVSLCLLQRDLEFKKLLFINNCSYFIGSGVVGISMALLGYSYWSLVAAVVVGRTLRVVLGLAARPIVPRFDFGKQETTELLNIGIGFCIGRLSSYLALVSDNFLTGKLLGATALGLYSRAYQAMVAPATYFGQILEKVLFPALAQRQSEPAKIARFFLFGIELCSIVGLSAAVMLYLVSAELVLVLLGPKWSGLVPVMQVFAPGVFFRMCYKNSETVIRSLGAVYRLALRQTFYAATVILGVLVGSKWGVEGVAAAVVVAVILNYLMLSFMCCRLLKIRISTFARAHVAAIWIGVWQFASVKFVLDLAHSSGFSSLLTLALSCLVLGFTTLIVCALSPLPLMPKVFNWMGKNLRLQRFGILGKFSAGLLLRGSPTADPTF